MSSTAIDRQRRRLTVSNCDPVVGAAGRGGATASDEEILDKVGVLEAFKAAGGARALSCTSVTDKDLKRKRSFAEKDAQILTPCEKKEDAKAMLEELNIGFCCKKGLKPESPNQDSFSIHVVENTFGLYGIYDGHGPWGHDISDLAREILVRKFFESRDYMTEPGKALTKAFVECQQQLEVAKGVDPSTSGSTCSVAFHNMSTDELTIAHVGDSRVVFGVRETADSAYEVIKETTDHKPDLPEERKRIESANPPGRVVFDGFYNHRVFAQAGNYPGLNMSRALGDVIAHKEAGLTAVPDVMTINLKEYKGNHELVVVLCTDGVWEFIKSSEALDIIKTEFGSKRSPGEVANKLAERSWDEWMKDSDHEISDDITVMMIPFQGDLR